MFLAEILKYQLEEPYVLDGAIRFDSAKILVGCNVTAEDGWTVFNTNRKMVKDTCHINSKWPEEYIALKILEKMDLPVKVPFASMSQDAERVIFRSKVEQDTFNYLYEIVGNHVYQFEPSRLDLIAAVLKHDMSAKNLPNFLPKINTHTLENIKKFPFLLVESGASLLTLAVDVIEPRVSLCKKYFATDLQSTIPLLKKPLAVIDSRFSFVLSKDFEVGKVPISMYILAEFEKKVAPFIESEKRCSDVSATESLKNILGDVFALFENHTTIMHSYLNDAFKTYPFLVKSAAKLTSTKLGFQPHNNIIIKVEDLLKHISENDVTSFLTKGKLDMLSDIDAKLSSDDFSIVKKYTGRSTVSLLKYLPYIKKMRSNVDALREHNIKSITEGHQPITISTGFLITRDAVKKVCNKRKIAEDDESNKRQRVDESDVETDVDNDQNAQAIQEVPVLLEAIPESHVEDSHEAVPEEVPQQDVEQDEVVDQLLQTIKDSLNGDQDLVEEVKKRRAGSESDELKKKCNLILKRLHKERADQYLKANKLASSLSNIFVKKPFNMLK